MNLRVAIYFFDGTRFDPIELELGGDHVRYATVVAAADGWIVVRGWADDGQRFWLSPGYRVDPGG